MFYFYQLCQTYSILTTVLFLVAKPPSLHEPRLDLALPGSTNSGIDNLSKRRRWSMLRDGIVD